MMRESFWGAYVLRPFDNKSVHNDKNSCQNNKDPLQWEYV